MLPTRATRKALRQEDFKDDSTSPRGMRTFVFCTRAVVEGEAAMHGLAGFAREKPAMAVLVGNLADVPFGESPV